jgi:tetratricopeptide (TPR) repeat protein/tRNA A-37 threonylcarbamoyl transferase component Bud32
VDALRGRFGKYHVLDKIAQGGMAEIYKVKTVGLAGFEKIQALKRILPSAAQHGRFIRSFIDEARIAVELSHRNIVQVFDFGKAEGDLYLAMELIEGQDLRSAMTTAAARDVRCPLAVAAYIISEVASGLDYAHRKVDAAGRSLGIVHCDMSPSNVMLSVDGYVKILDFGIARASFSSALERRRLRGKPRYMAPEQTRGDAPTAATDVFALGIIAWELLAGRALFGGSTLRDILHEVRTFEIPHLRDEGVSVPAEMADAIAVALQRDPASRGTASDLGTACLRTALASGPRGVAGWQDELEQRASSPAFGQEAGGGVERAVSAAARELGKRRELAPRRPSAISIELRAAGAQAGDSVELAAEELAAGGPAGDGGGGTEAEAQFPWDDGGPVERRTATLPAASPFVMGRPDALAFAAPGADELAARDAAEAAARDAAEALAREESSAGITIDALPKPRTMTPQRGAARRPPSPSADEPSVISSAPMPAPIAALTLPAPPIIRRPTTASPVLIPSMAARAPGASRRATSVMDVVVETPEDKSAAVRIPDREPAPAEALAAASLSVPEPAEPAVPAAGSSVKPLPANTTEPEAPAPARPISPSDGSTPGPRWAAEGSTDVAAEAPLPAPMAARLWGFDVRSFDSESAHEEAIDDRPNEFDMEAVAPLHGRRRIVVVAALLDGAAPDTLRALARGLGELAYQRGGVALSVDERALILVFGLELAGEDDAAVAMTWAVDASAIARESASEGKAPQLRIGGRAGAFATVEGEGPPEIAAELIEEARSLARQAQPDHPLFTGGAGRVGSALFALREVATKRERGRGGRALEVVGVRPVVERDTALLERRGRFVGRNRELSLLDACRQRAVVEQRRVVAVIRGPSGVGKSRLGAEVVAQVLAQSPQTALMVASAGPATRLSPFCLVLDFVQAVLNLPPQRGRAARDKLSQRLVRVLRRGEIEPAVIRAVTGDLERAMELRDGVYAPDASELADLPDRVGAALTVVRRCLRALHVAESEGYADRLTAIIVIENLHHADATSLLSMRPAMANREHGSELFLITTEGEPPSWPFLDEVIALGDLVGGELRALAVDRLGEAATALNVAGVIGRGGGTPLFVEELAAAAQRAGEELPGTARDVVAARVDRLSAAAQTAVRYAAVLGETVRARFLEEVIGQGDIGEALEELVGDGLMDRRDDAAPESPEGELSFARGLFREVIYDGLSPRALRDAHARVGRLLAARFFAGREEPPALIAEHLEKGGEVAAAAAFWLRAGRISLAAADAAAAAGTFTRCLELEAGLGKSPPSAPSRVRRREAHLGREEATRRLGALDDGDADLDALEGLCAEQPRRLADVENRRAQRQLRRGDHAGALTATLRAEQLARTAGDERLRAEALRLRGEVYEVQGQLDQALSFVAQAGTIFRRHGYLTDEIGAMVGTGRIHLLRAHYEAARDTYRPVIDSIQKTGDPWLERIVRNHLALIEMCLGNFGEAMAMAQRSIELCRRYGDRAREGDTLSVMAMILSKVGLYEAAASTFDSALDILGRTSSRWARTDCLIWAGACDVRRGLAVGIAKLDEAIAEARQLGARTLEASGLVARAEARLVLGEATAAASDAEAGTLLARRATLVGCEIQGLARQAVALHQLGSLEQATPLARRALAMLEAQGTLEGAEEEVLQACGKVLLAAGELEEGERALARARAVTSRKLASLTEPSWRAAYAAVVEQRQLLREN